MPPVAGGAKQRGAAHRLQLLCFVLSVYALASAVFAAAFYLLSWVNPDTLDGQPKAMLLIEARPITARGIASDA